MSKIDQEQIGGLKTLKLARGSATLGSPSRHPGQRTPSGSGKSHFGIHGNPKSPGAGSKTNSLITLTQNGIIELLEQDERPTFVLDLAEQSITDPGPLKIVFANAAMRVARGVLDTVSGITAQESPSLAIGTPFSGFKSWCTSYIKGHEPRDVVLPSFKFAGAMWNSSNLQKRFRVFRGDPITPNAKLAPNAASLGLPSTSPASKENDKPSGTPSGGEFAIEEEPKTILVPPGTCIFCKRKTTMVPRKQVRSPMGFKYRV